MSDRIYTIPAREVVAGMYVVNVVQRHCEVTTVVDEDDGTGHRRIIGSAINWSLPGDARLSVSLPGPSPRELLCSCCSVFRRTADALGEPFDGETSPPDDHDDNCPVRRLRLRLWPVGARWDGERWDIPVTRDDGVVVALPVYPGHVIQALSHRGMASAALRAAFCEPVNDAQSGRKV